ncbi:hypothetical protein PCYB_103190 [Plasmodium cynomolgi strain B]|uniref:Uncharacterized protein n=1 Tax=Plasmodium cynomolgi (strain B) TaxID=1120755 RepID=K6UUA4_PLACD|nr:hypothetical protein PCYB_103190 [Plasmodium cynomolgi strain B]GAB66969.1 hypothetical protein PCYB_103190 [Plasmodium cynomolgi strain B]
MKGGLNRVKAADIELKDDPSCIDSIIFNDMEMGGENYSVLDNADASFLRSFPDSGDGSLSYTGANETPFQELSGEDAKRTPEMELILEDHFEARRSDNLFEVHIFKESQSGQLAETPVGHLEREKEESPKGVVVNSVGDTCVVNSVGDTCVVKSVGDSRVVNSVGDSREVNHMGDDHVVSHVGDTREVSHAGQLDHLNILCDVDPCVHQKRNAFR